ncbi:unnamed protein product [Rotaria sp. Silwood1]|nr:unnamed protein product [Rotaria sp. Silwood1]CAF3476300.1 unnamed protein product [Rotaria sp. Silwood1]CAF3488609.1 unnamed protein product [Rotaria sp. Silwood1]CAF4632060.1 unnamed protein product [Rotaria sp. Silwood1]CAF4851815.1 unnamed protein product [Rotaria sp. Silwood1]
MKKISSSDFRLVSIAIGDFNDDNKFDFAVGANSHPNSIAVDDFNNDNQLDIVVTNEDVNSIGLLLGYGNENFANQTILLNQSDFQPFSITIADIDHDHCLDIIVANHKNESISVIFGDGNDKVKSIIQYSIGYSSRPYSIVLYDFNNDTHIDIAVTDDATNTINILFEYGNISFEKINTLSTGYNSKPLSLAVGDFNNDLLLDLAVTLTGTNNIGILSKLC